MFVDPALDEPLRETVFDHRCLALWMEALRRPESDLRIDAVSAFAAAHKAGVRDVGQAVPAIRTLLREDSRPAVRSAAALALIDLDDREAAADLLALVMQPSTGIGITRVVDAALASWDYAPARAHWLQLVRGRYQSPARAASAMNALALSHAPDAAPDLLGCVTDPRTSMPLRLQAAQALQRTSPDGLESVAGRLLADGTSAEALLAVTLLGRHSGAVSEQLLTPLLSHSDPTVRSAAFRTLAASNPGALVRTHAAAIEDPDDEVRLIMTTVFAHSRTEASVRELARRLGDISQPVRTTAASALLGLADDPALAATVAASISKSLRADDWRALEQAAMLAGAVGLSGQTPRLIELLTFERPETRLAAAAALRRLQAPETMPALLNRAEALTSAARGAAADPDAYESIGQETAQLFIAIARAHYAPAEPLLLRYIPKRSGFHPVARGAAIYALGLLSEDGGGDGMAAVRSADRKELIRQLSERVADNNPLDPEAAEVRRFSAVALGRMRSKESLGLLRDFYEAENTTVSVGGSCRWAIMQIEGVNLPALSPIPVRPGPFFLEPIDSAPESVRPSP